VFDFGAVADDNHDDLPAFLAAVAALRADNRWGGNLIIPCASYFLNGTFNLHWKLNIFARGSIMRFPPNVRGIVFHEYRTLDNGSAQSTDTGLGDAAGSVMEGGMLYGGMAGSIGHGPWTNPAAVDPTSYGIEVRTAFVSIYDAWVYFFSGHGVFVHGYAGVPSPDGGQASINQIDNLITFYNQGFGIKIIGSDANICNIRGGSHISNGLGGYCDDSFLGCNAYGIHVRDCGVLDPNAGDAPVACCQYQGNQYYLVAGQDALATTTVPGTNPAVWAPRWGLPGYTKMWVPGITWATGGPYIIATGNQGNSSAMVTGCYQESGQPPAQVNTPAMVVGGSMGVNGVAGSGVYVRGDGFNRSGLAAPSFHAYPIDWASNPTGDVILYGTGYIADLYSADGSNMQLGYDSSFLGGGPAGQKTFNVQFGHSPVPMAVTSDRVYIRRTELGSNWTGSQVGTAWSIDSLLQAENGKHCDYGDTFLCTDPAQGTPIGFICSQSGIIGDTVNPPAVFEPFGSKQTSGSVGPAGPAGPTGQAGPVGPAGSPGAIASIPIVKAADLATLSMGFYVVTDARSYTVGSTVRGGGTLRVLIWYNGTVGLVISRS
jgi:hypothetical protein